MPDAELTLSLNAWSVACRAELEKGRLVLPHCPVCDRVWEPAVALCPNDPDHPLELIAASGDGELRTWVTYHRDYGVGIEVPYTVGLVELTEGPRIEALVQSAGLPVHAGLRLRFESSTALPSFVVAEAS